jgi:hypothetical protein
MSYFTKWPFRLVPKRNPEIWADRAALLAEVEPYFKFVESRENISKILVLWGAFGAGKSHLLRHMKWRLENDDSGFVVYSPFPKQRIRGFRELYQASFASRMDFHTLGRNVAYIWKSYDGDEMKFLFDVTEETDYWYDFAQVILTVGKLFINTPKISDPYFGLCRNWLMAEKLRAEERRTLGVKNDIRTDEDAIRLFSSLVRFLSGRGEIKTIVWMLDDCHILLSQELLKFKDIILYGLKTVFDETPDNLILLLSFATKDPDAVDEFLIPDLLRRIQKIDIGAMTDEDAFLFVSDLLTTYQIKKEPIYYPFEEEACIHAIITEVAKRGLSPGNLMGDLNQLVGNAEREIYPKLINFNFIQIFYS